MKYLAHTMLLSELNTSVLIVLIGFMICNSCAIAQSGAGSIQGIASDSTGAVIPGATIHVANQATAVSADTKTNSVGFYQLPSLFAGTYTVTATATGMKSYKTNVQLLVGQQVVLNPILTAGSVTEEIVVVADSVQLVTTDSGSIASTLDNSRINQLPMNGRSLFGLASEVTPGLEAGNRANGLFGEALEFVADGVPVLNRQGGGNSASTLTMVPDPDAVQEVRIESTNGGAQFATPGTAIINTKSGTNSFHGSLFETARNNAIGIAKARQNAANYAAPHLVRNEFGISAGGPVILPRIYDGRGKSFWFAAYERYSLVQNAQRRVAVPTLAMRNGDFSGLINSAGIQQKLYDPQTTGSPLCNHGQPSGQYCRVPFGGKPDGSTTSNYIPANRMAPIAKTLMNMTPSPQTNDNPLITGNYFEPGATYVVVPTITFRLDHSFNEKNKAYLRYTSNNQTYRVPASASSGVSLEADGIPAGISGLSTQPSSNYAAAIGYTHIFSSSFFSETIVGQQWWSQSFAEGIPPNHNYEQDLGLPNNFGQLGFPNIGTAGAALIFPYNSNQGGFGLSQIITNLDENLTKTSGRHQMQFGGRYRHERFGDSVDRTADSISFNGYGTGLEDPTSGANYNATPNTGNVNADLYLGSAATYQVTLNPPYVHFHDMEFDAYFQDNFHVSKNLTINAGLRWEAHPATWVKSGLMNGFDLKNDAQVTAATPSSLVAGRFTSQAVITNMQNLGVKFETPAEAGFPNKLIDDYNFTFGPRIGIAWRPFGNSLGAVLRGGYGRYIYPVPTRSTTKNVLQNQPFQGTYQQNYNSGSQSPDGLNNYQLRAPQSVVMGVNSSNVVDTRSVTAIQPGIQLWTFDPKFAPAMVTSANITLEQPLKGNSALRLSWVFSQATNLDDAYLYNSHPSNFTYEMQTGTTVPGGALAGVATGPYDKTKYSGSSILQQKNGWSNDNALQATYQRLYHHGVAYQINYVFSKAMRIGGNSTRDSQVYTAASYLGSSPNVGTMSSPYGTVIAPVLPPARPAGIASYDNWHELQRYEQYQIDSSVPKHRVSFNGIVDLPFGKGKRFLSNSNWFLNALLGGFQIAGAGTVFSQYFQVGNGNFGPTNPIHVYKHSHPITDCRSGTCYKAYQWFNGYIPPTVIDAATKGVSGLPADYLPYSSPIDTNPNPTPADPTAKYYNTNNVVVTLANGSQNTIAYSPGQVGTNPYSHTFLNGPFNYTVDLSLFKVFAIRDNMNLRVNVDAFNALNVQGYNNPNGTDGTQSLLSSYNTPRQIQLSVRLTF